MIREPQTRLKNYRKNCQSPAIQKTETSRTMPPDAGLGAGAGFLDFSERDSELLGFGDELGWRIELTRA